MSSSISGVVGLDHMQEVMRKTNEAVTKRDNPVIDIEKSLIHYIRDFESKLNAEEEVLLLAASFGSSVTFYVTSIQFSRPNLIVFSGTTGDGGSTQLIQHCSQLNFLLKAVPKKDPEEERKPIGFLPVQ